MTRRPKYDPYQMHVQAQFAAEVGMFLLLDHELRFDQLGDTELAMDMLIKAWESPDDEVKPRAVAARIAIMSRSDEDIIKDLEASEGDEEKDE